MNFDDETDITVPEGPLSAELPQSELDRRLLIAVELGDYNTCSDAIYLGANPNAAHNTGLSALHIAAEKGFYGVMKSVIRAAKDSNKDLYLDSMTVFGNTPLLLATMNNSVDCLELLLEAGANPNKTCTFNRTPLHTAAFLGRSQVVWKLLQFGAEVNATDSFDMTPLGLALLGRNSTTVVQWLLQGGADPNFRSKSSIPLLSTAVLGTTRFRDLRFLTFLLTAGADVHARDMVKENTALHYAAQTGFLPAIDLLVAAGADLSAENAYGETPLNTAIRFGNSQAALHIYQKEEQMEEEELRRLASSSNKKKKTRDILR